MAERNSERADALLVERGLCDSREQAKRLIMAGEVLCGTERVAKPSSRIRVDADLSVRERPRYVGRGGLKLEGALQEFALDPTGLICLDLGSSTGGFTDCLLQHGASRVHAVDVGTNQLAWRLRQDDRVSLHEQTDARSIDSELLGGHIDLCVMDASFISARLLLPVLRAVLPAKTPLLLLVKPQFEVGKEHIGKGGLVSDPERIKDAVDAVSACAADLGFRENARVASRIHGARAGNTEVFLLVDGHNEC